MKRKHWLYIAIAILILLIGIVSYFIASMVSKKSSLKNKQHKVVMADRTAVQTDTAQMDSAIIVADAKEEAHLWYARRQGDISNKEYSRRLEKIASKYLTASRYFFYKTFGLGNESSKGGNVESDIHYTVQRVSQNWYILRRRVIIKSENYDESYHDVIRMITCPDGKRRIACVIASSDSNAPSDKHVRRSVPMMKPRYKDERTFLADLIYNFYAPNYSIDPHAYGKWVKTVKQCYTPSLAKEILEQDHTSNIPFAKEKLVNAINYFALVRIIDPVFDNGLQFVAYCKFDLQPTDQPHCWRIGMDDGYQHVTLRQKGSSFVIVKDFFERIDPYSTYYDKMRSGDNEREDTTTNDSY